ncbi:magnesium transporter [Candidatus Woesearchaeota archaeon]|nr:magnesium transporter [Candidatus Woesearchaeota archaeon]
MAIFDANFKEIFSSQLVSIIGGLIAGTILAVYTDQILLIPGMLILLPGFLEMRGNISGSFAARLSSGLFLRVINADRTKTKLIRGNLFASFFLAFFVSLALGVIAFLFNLIVFKLFTLKIIFLPLIAGIIANAIEIPLTLFVTFYLFKKGHDPNNIMGPFVTSTGDITSIASLLIALVII